MLPRIIAHIAEYRFVTEVCLCSSASLGYGFEENLAGFKLVVLPL
jgi:hypothetical protein